MWVTDAEGQQFWIDDVPVDTTFRDAEGNVFGESPWDYEARRISEENAKIGQPVSIQISPELARANELKEQARKNYNEAKGRAAQSRWSLESLIQQFHDIASGRTKTEAEQVFEQQYQGAQNSAMANMAALEGMDQASLMRLRAQQAGAIQARREQDRRVLREQITDQAKQQEAGLTGVLAQGDEATANLDALYNQGMSALDWEEKTGQATRAWDKAKGDYGLAVTGAKNALGDYGRDAAFWQGLAGNVAELGGTTAAYGQKSGWFTGKKGAK